MSTLSEIKELESQILLYRNRDPEKAYELCEELLALSGLTGNEYGSAFAQYYMCEVSVEDRDFDDTVKKLFQLKESFHSSGFYEFEIKSNILLGILFDNKYDTFVSLDHYQTAVSLAKEYNLQALESIATCDIGCIFSRLDDNRTALGYYEDAFNILSSVDPTPSNKYYLNLFAANLATTHVALGNLDEGEKYYDLVMADDPDDPLQIAILDIAKAMILYQKGFAEDAHAFATRGTEALVGSHSIYDTIDAITNCYRILIDLEEYDLLEQYFHSSLEYTKQKRILAFRRDIFELYIDYLKTVGNEKQLTKAYKEYYELNSTLSTKENRTDSRSLKLKLSLLEASRKHKQSIEQNELLTKLSQTDELTHLPNRYKYDANIPYYFSRAQLEHKHFCYIIMDVDCFKQYNDTYGHLKGDSCLWHISNVLRSEMSNDVIFFRYGGDEFAGIYFDKSDEYIAESVERLENGIHGLGLEHKCSLRFPFVSVTIGYVNALPDESDTALSVINEADILLYKKKAEWKKAKH